jgi:transcriptional regulator with XRE-family HTH domain
MRPRGGLTVVSTMTLRDERDLAQLILDLGLTQRKVAERARISEGFMSQICRAKPCRQEVAARICAALGGVVEVDFLFKTRVDLSGESVSNIRSSGPDIRRPA